MNEISRFIQNTTTRLALTASLVAFTFGCVQERSVTGERRLVIPQGDPVERVERFTTTPGSPILTQTSLAASFSLTALGVVPYDGFTLPIIWASESNRFIAVQTGARPTWDALLAQSRTGAEASDVSLYKLDTNQDPSLIATHTGPLILGRTSNEDGVLVERPNPDGSRWIGIAPWDGSDIRWLVSNKNVNAFAWLGKKGTLVFSSRAQDEMLFRLAILRADGTQWSLPESLPYSWLLPVLDDDEQGLFAMRLGDGYADLAWGRAENAAFFRQTLRVHRTSDRVDVQRAWQMMAATTGGSGVNSDQIAWFSFEMGRLILWKPQQDETALLPESSVAAFFLPREEKWLVTTTSRLDLVALLQTTTAITSVFESPWVARNSKTTTPLIVNASTNQLILAELTTVPAEPTSE